MRQNFWQWLYKYEYAVEKAKTTIDIMQKKSQLSSCLKP